MNVKSRTNPPLRVAIVGGGPAGTACALRLQLLSTQLDRAVHVTIIEGKEFHQEQHYNQCVGVLSPPLPELLTRDLNVDFPSFLVRSPITGYYLHTPGAEIALLDEQPSMALRRVQFDAYMLDMCRERHIDIVNARAVDLEFHDQGVLIYTENAPVPADVVVGAFGMDDGGASLFSRLTDYTPPDALSSVVTKYHPDQTTMKAFGSQIHAFLPPDPRIEFAGITPKGNHLTINIAGQDVASPLMNEFLAQPWVAKHLPNLGDAGRLNPGDLRFFKGRFPHASAHHYYADRFVMVGDASGLVRSFKGKGVTTAVQTGIRAADTILTQGITARAFHAHFRKANDDLIQDLPYGQLMRRITIWLSRTGLLSGIIRGAQTEPALHTALFGAVAGVTPYREILKDALKPRNLVAILRSMRRG
ncbi:MAG: FAD/NAD(P)-binding protein [Anaerolineales bacterium]|nr:FAD/NAD(P)-binding protein [Anaerolineales bacterium]